MLVHTARIGSETPEEDEMQIQQFDATQHLSMLLMDMMRCIVGGISVKMWQSILKLNVQYINGLDTQPALMVLTKHAVHLFSNIQLNRHETNDKTISRGLHEGEYLSLLSSTPLSDLKDCRSMYGHVLSEILKTEHSYKCMELQDVYTVFKHRYQLKATALELTDKFGSSLLFACGSEQELDDLLKILLDSKRTFMPSSILQKYVGITDNLGTSYESITGRYMSTATKLWLKGEMSNFDYLMHLNIAAGRSFRDLTSYPVFPWVLADYKSEKLDFSNPRTFRDFSKPMGAIGERRAAQFKERFDSLNDFRGPDSAPPFYYGTHYSCTGYVLHFLMRLQPYTQMAISHQGGQFDKADRLFRSIEVSSNSKIRPLFSLLQ